MFDISTGVAQMVAIGAASEATSGEASEGTRMVSLVVASEVVAPGDLGVAMAVVDMAKVVVAAVTEVASGGHLGAVVVVAVLEVVAMKEGTRREGEYLFFHFYPSVSYLFKAKKKCLVPMAQEWQATQQLSDDTFLYDLLK